MRSSETQEMWASAQDFFEFGNFDGFEETVESIGSKKDLDQLLLFLAADSSRISNASIYADHLLMFAKQQGNRSELQGLRRRHPSVAFPPSGKFPPQRNPALQRSRPQRERSPGPRREKVSRRMWTSRFC